LLTSVSLGNKYNYKDEDDDEDEDQLCDSYCSVCLEISAPKIKGISGKASWEPFTPVQYSKMRPAMSREEEFRTWYGLKPCLPEPVYRDELTLDAFLFGNLTYRATD
jgi:hypothetical protein